MRFTYNPFKMTNNPAEVVFKKMSWNPPQKSVAFVKIFKTPLCKKKKKNLKYAVLSLLMTSMCTNALLETLH